MIERTAARPGEHITYLEATDPDAAAVLYVVQHGDGFMAFIKGVGFQAAQPAAWCDGWLDAKELGEYAPLEWYRMNAEV